MPFQAFIKRVLAVVFIVVLLLALWFLRDTLLLAFLGVVIAVGISIPARSLQRLGLGRGWATALAVVVIGLAFIVLVLWLVPTLVVGFGDLLAGLPQVVRNLAENYNSLRSSSEFLSRVLPPVEVERSSGLSEAQVRNLFRRAVNTGLPILVSGSSAAVSLLTNVVLVLFIAVLLIVDPFAYVKASLYLTPKPHHARVLRLWDELYSTLKHWLTSISISITITVGLVLVVLGLLGMPNVLVVAVFAGFATFVPNIGAFLPLVPIAVFTLPSPSANFIIMAAAYLAIQLLESNVLSPLIVKRELSIPAAGMLVFQLVAGIVFGLLGVLLAVPLLAVVITLVRELYSYDALGLRGDKINVALGRDGRLRLTEGGSVTERVPEKRPRG